MATTRYAATDGSSRSPLGPIGDDDDHGTWWQPMTPYDSISFGFRDIDDVNFSDSTQGTSSRLRWPAVSTSSNHSCKTHCFELKAWTVRRTDRRTDRIHSVA